MTQNISWPTKDDDFLPYASDEHSYWTGYYSSRPTSKYFMREAEYLSQVHDQLSVLYNMPVTDDNPLDEVVAVVQHHDAITGTERQHVADNYHLRLYSSLESAYQNLSLQPVLDSDIGDNTFCPFLNISQCPSTENIESQLYVRVYNPLSWARDTFTLQLPVVGSNYRVTDQVG